MPARRARRHRGRRGCVASLTDHHVRRLDDRQCIVADFEGEIVHRLVGDRRSDDDPAADIDANMRRRLTFGHRDDLALELIAGAELHETLLWNWNCEGRAARFDAAAKPFAAALGSIYPIGYRDASSIADPSE